MSRISASVPEPRDCTATSWPSRSSQPLYISPFTTGKNRSVDIRKNIRIGASAFWMKA